MITMKCQSEFGKGDVLEVQDVGVAHKPQLSFLATCGDNTEEIVLDLEQVTKLGAQLTAWAKKQGVGANDPKKFVGSL